MSAASKLTTLSERHPLGLRQATPKLGLFLSSSTRVDTSPRKILLAITRSVSVRGARRGGRSCGGAGGGRGSAVPAGAGSEAWAESGRLFLTAVTGGPPCREGAAAARVKLLTGAVPSGGDKSPTGSGAKSFRRCSAANTTGHSLGLSGPGIPAVRDLAS